MGSGSDDEAMSQQDVDALLAAAESSAPNAPDRDALAARARGLTGEDKDALLRAQVVHALSDLVAGSGHLGRLVPDILELDEPRPHPEGLEVSFHGSAAVDGEFEGESRPTSIRGTLVLDDALRFVYGPDGRLLLSPWRSRLQGVEWGPQAIRLLASD